jgi:hypothetical protein
MDTTQFAIVIAVVLFMFALMAGFPFAQAVVLRWACRWLKFDSVTYGRSLAAVVIGLGGGGFGITLVSASYCYDPMSTPMILQHLAGAVFSFAAAIIGSHYLLRENWWLSFQAVVVSGMLGAILLFVIGVCIFFATLVMTMLSGLGPG